MSKWRSLRRKSSQTVNIVGFAKSAAYFDGGSHGEDTWRFNDAVDLRRPCTAFFELHHWRDLARGWTMRQAVEAHLAAMQSLTIPLVTLHPWPELPQARRFPYAAIQTALPGCRHTYHQSSMDWLVALAIYEGYSHIHLAGVNFLHDNEPLAARAALEYWCGIANGRGIEVTIANPTSVFKTVQYIVSEEIYAAQYVPPILWPEDIRG